MLLLLEHFLRKFSQLLLILIMPRKKDHLSGEIGWFKGADLSLHSIQRFVHFMNQLIYLFLQMALPQSSLHPSLFPMPFKIVLSFLMQKLHLEASFTFFSDSYFNICSLSKVRLISSFFPQIKIALVFVF